MSAVSDKEPEFWATGPEGRGRISLPEPIRSPWWALTRRLLAALAILVGTVCLVYFDADGYRPLRASAAAPDTLPSPRRTGLICRTLS